VLVHGGPPPVRALPEETLAPGVAELLDHLDPHPSYVTGRCWDVLGANRAARALWRLPAEQTNLLLWMFTPDARTVFVEWEKEAAAQLARFRTAAARYPGDPQFADVTERLLSHREAREWWARHDVARLASGRKRLRHPELGELELRHVVLQVADEPEQKLVTFAPDPDDGERIAALIA
jgi:hypothetical protein